MKGGDLILIFLLLLLTLSCSTDIPQKKYDSTVGKAGVIEKPIVAPKVAAPPPNLNDQPHLNVKETKNITENSTNLGESNLAFVEIIDMGFVPSKLNISSNTTVIWINKDWSGYYGRHHLVVSSLNKFRSSRILYNETFSFTFTEPGTYKYLDPTYKSGTTGGILIPPGIIYVE